MSGPIRLGVAGLGFGSHVHVPAFRAVKGCVVAAICGSRLDRAQRAADLQKIPKAYGHWRDLIADSEIDAVSFALPPTLQPMAVKRAAECGKHVFCEKPASLNPQQAEEMLKAVRKAGVVHAVDLLFPELETWRRAKTYLRKGALGHLRSVTLSWRLETLAYRKNISSSWKRQDKYGGGTLNNFVSHSFYYLEWLFGKIVRINARLRPVGAAGDARVDLWLEFAAGFPATASVAADAFRGDGHRLEVNGEKGTMVLHNPAPDYVSGFSLSLGTRSNNGLSIIARQPRKKGLDGRIAAVSAIANRFIKAIKGHGAVVPNLEQGLRVQQLMNAARASSHEGRWHSVP